MAMVLFIAVAIFPGTGIDVRTNVVMRQALIVFAKIPRPGHVKTRLTGFLSEEEAAQVYEAFLRDALDQYQDLDADVRLYVSPPGRPRPAALVPEGIEVFEQTGAGLGERMQQAFLASFAAGYGRLVIIGTDHPTLPTAYIEEAFRALVEPLSVCIGPSEDGGYYLLGMNEFYPRLFTEMTYSHPRVFEQTLERILATRAHSTVLPMWYDVDTPGDLARLVQELDASGDALVHTRQVIERLRLADRLAAHLG